MGPGPKGGGSFLLFVELKSGLGYVKTLCDAKRISEVIGCLNYQCTFVCTITTSNNNLTLPIPTHPLHKLVYKLTEQLFEKCHSLTQTRKKGF